MYVGCWEDKNTPLIFSPADYNSRDFDVYIVDNSFEWQGLTLDRCIPACVTLGYRYAALQVETNRKQLTYKSWGILLLKRTTHINTNFFISIFRHSYMVIEFHRVSLNLSSIKSKINPLKLKEQKKVRNVKIFCNLPLTLMGDVLHCMQ